MFWDKTAKSQDRLPRCCASGIAQRHVGAEGSGRESFKVTPVVLGRVRLARVSVCVRVSVWEGFRGTRSSLLAASGPVPKQERGLGRGCWENPDSDQELSVPVASRAQAAGGLGGAAADLGC